jgi:uncharacterized membrane protein YtjA (UPF0391 family)
VSASHWRPVEAMSFYWPVVFVIVAVAAASIGFINQGAPDALAARLVGFVFLGLAAVLTVARQWRRRIHRP